MRKNPVSLKTHIPPSELKLQTLVLTATSIGIEALWLESIYKTCTATVTGPFSQGKGMTDVCGAEVAPGPECTCTYVSERRLITPEDIPAWLNHDRGVELITALGTSALLVDRGYKVEVACLPQFDWHKSWIIISFLASSDSSKFSSVIPVAVAA